MRVESFSFSLTRLNVFEVSWLHRPSDTFPHVKSASHSFLLRLNITTNCKSIIMRGAVKQ